MVALVKDVQPQRIDGARRPQPQQIDVPSAPADDRRVVSDGLDRFIRQPNRARAAVYTRIIDATAILNVIDDFGPLEFPGVAKRQPVLRKFLLPAIFDDLAEQPVIIADPIAARRNPERRHAIHKAGGEPPETAITQGRVGLGQSHAIEIDTEITERHANCFGQP